ncbi:unnamed protein product [Linum trigynum]
MAERGDSSSGTRKYNPTSMQAAPSHATIGAASFDKPNSFQGKGPGRSPNRRGSPGPTRRGSPAGIVLNRHPKLRLGNNRQKQVGTNKKEVRMADADPPTVKVYPQHSSPVRADSVSNLGGGGEQPTRIHADTRRRRLILEEDSDDDMVDVTQMPTGNGLGVKPEGAPKHPTNFIIPPEAGVIMPGKGKSRRSKDHPRLTAGGRAEMRTVGEMGEAPQIPDEAAGPSAGQAAVSGAPVMGDDTLKKRKPRRAKTQLIRKEGEEAFPREESAVEMRSASSKPVASRGRRILLKSQPPREMDEGIRDGCDKVMGDYRQSDPDSLKGAIEAPHSADSESEESGLGEESQEFMIKKRSPLADPLQHGNPSKGRVSQVVAVLKWV